MLDEERHVPNDEPERREPKRGEVNATVAWCSPHNCHPLDCFDLHYPNAHGRVDA